MVRRCYVYWLPNTYLASQGGSVVKKPPANKKDVSSVPRSARFPGEGDGNLVQYSCLGNSIDRVTWQTTIHRVAKESDMIQQLNNNKNTYLSLMPRATPMNKTTSTMKKYLTLELSSSKCRYGPEKSESSMQSALALLHKNLFEQVSEIYFFPLEIDFVF